MDLAEIFAAAVEERARGGGLLKGTEAGMVLREEHLARNLPTGRGAYRATIEEAVQRSLVRRVRRDDGGLDLFLPPEAQVPTGYHEVMGPKESRSSEGVMGLPDDVLFLRKEVYQAFTGLAGPAWIDPSTQPTLDVLWTESLGALPVDPVQASLVADAWCDFAAAEALDVDVIEQVEEYLREGIPERIWGRIEIPGDSAKKSLGSRFFKRRVRLIIRRIRQWAEENSLDLNKYSIADPTRLPARLRPKAEETRSSPPFGKKGDPTEQLRKRLHRVIDRMTLAQLSSLKVPAEYLLD